MPDKTIRVDSGVQGFLVRLSYTCQFFNANDKDIILLTLLKTMGEHDSDNVIQAVSIRSLASKSYIKPNNIERVMSCFIFLSLFVQQVVL